MDTKRMIDWIEANPYAIYGHCYDKLPDEMAQMLLEGELEKFDESFWEMELQIADGVDWSAWESEFTKEFYAPNVSFDQLPETIQDLVIQHRNVEVNDLLHTMIENWDGRVIARLVKRNGEYIEFPHRDHAPSTNKRLQAYLKRHCGIDGWEFDAIHTQSYLTVLGTMNLWEVYYAQVKPKNLFISHADVVLGHERARGSGTTSGKYKGAPRVMLAEFSVDGQDGYGVQAVYGFTSDVWKNELRVQIS
jgi:hypothetical protein